MRDRYRWIEMYRDAEKEREEGERERGGRERRQ